MVVVLAVVGVWMALGGVVGRGGRSFFRVVVIIAVGRPE